MIQVGVWGLTGFWGTTGLWGARRKANWSFRLRLHSGLRQRGAHSSRKKPRDEWGTRSCARRREASRGWGVGGGGGLVVSVARRKASWSLRLRLHSGLRQRGAHSSRKEPRDEWGTRVLRAAGGFAWRGVGGGGGAEGGFAWLGVLWVRS